MGEDGESMSGRTNYCYFTKQKISTKQKETTYTNKNKSHTHTHNAISLPTYLRGFILFFLYAELTVQFC